MADARRLYCLYIYSMLSAFTIAENNLGPLTTTFTPPSTCFFTTAFPATGGGEDVTGAGVAYAETYLQIVSNAATSCYPSNYGYSGDSNNYFSPGLICPLGYSTGGFLTILSGETLAFCCPSGFRQPGNSIYHGCSKTIIGVLTASAVLTRSGTGLEFYLGSMSTQFSSTEHTLSASAIPLRWRAVDLPSSPTTATSNPSSPSSFSSISSTSTGSGATTLSTDKPSFTSTSQSISPSSATGSTSSGGGLSRSDKIALGVGIGVGVTIGLPGAIVALVKIWKMFRAQPRP
ncbi:hypothetical protein B0O99DRAFT_633525 [Bisporella sp. PMI_857]|nr:hypothetical protein B0O99DRAFT_633525 [Bisporella sp. PMI_857]